MVKDRVCGVRNVRSKVPLPVIPRTVIRPKCTCAALKARFSCVLRRLPSGNSKKGRSNDKKIMQKLGGISRLRWFHRSGDLFKNILGNGPVSISGNDRRCLLEIRIAAGLLTNDSPQKQTRKISIRHAPLLYLAF